MDDDVKTAFDKLQSWCRDHGYKGHDPFDGLNSRLFQATPLRHSRLARLAWTQFFKRFPFDLRDLAGVPEEKNSKGTALFALAALARFRSERTREAATEARHFLNDLVEVLVEGQSGAAWGYNFDWQGRAFFAPKGTPTIVPTAFAARALIEGAQAFNDSDYLKVARSSCDFILQDLNRSEESDDEVCWSYSPIDHTRVFNASLLAAETLASVGSITKEKELIEWAVRGARYVVRRQRADGSWAYGGADFQSWADNFHTAFILTSLSRIINASSEVQNEFADAAIRGYEFWRKNFFLADGCPKYYHHQLYPIDTHSAGAAIIALLETYGVDNEALTFAQKIAQWSIQNLFDKRG